MERECEIVSGDAGSTATLRVFVRGSALLRSALLNKGTAFTEEERADFGLDGLVPPVVRTLEEQVAHAYHLFAEQPTPIAKYAFLRALQDRQEIVFCALLEAHMTELLPIVSRLVQMGWSLVATDGTARALRQAGFSPQVVAKIGEAGPTVVDIITQGQVDLVINTMSNIYAEPGEVGGPVFKDGFEIRRAAVERRIPCLTSLDTATALLESAVAASRDMEVRTIEEWREGVPA